MESLIDPLVFKERFWPDVTFYGQQEDVIYSVEHNNETYVPAGNQLGKDFVAGFVVLSVFLRAALARKTCRIVTTSATQKHLNVLWSEIDRYIRNSKIPLRVENGGPLRYNHLDILRCTNGVPEKENYVIGVVSTSENRGEGLAGHHAEITLGVIDEASGSGDVVYEMFQGWCKRILVLGNPHPCTNFFRRAVKAGDLIAT